MNETRAALPEWWVPESASVGDEQRHVTVMEHPLKDGDDSRASTAERLRGAVVATRERRLHSPSVSVDAERPVPEWFHGHCVGNTLALLDELKRRDIECRPITGAHRDDVTARMGPDDRPPTDAERAVSMGVQHHWVEAVVDRWRWHVDAAQYRYDEADGAPYIGLVPPDPYVVFEDSRRFGEQHFADVRERIDVDVVGEPLHGDGWSEKWEY